MKYLDQDGIERLASPELYEFLLGGGRIKRISGVNQKTSEFKVLWLELDTTCHPPKLFSVGEEDMLTIPAEFETQDSDDDTSEILEEAGIKITETNVEDYD